MTTKKEGECSEEQISANIAKLINEGKPRDQAVAIAFEGCPQAQRSNSPLFTQAETGYTQTSPSDDERCGNCVFFNRNEDEVATCLIVESQPQEIVAEGLCSQWVAKTYSSRAGDYEEDRGRKKSIYFGGGLKLIGKDRIGGYLVRYGSDSEKDLQGEYFTKDSDFVLDLYEQRPALYHHGLDEALNVKRIGVIDTIKQDEIGLWAEAQMDSHNQYIDAVKKLIKKGILSWSSGAFPHLVDVAADGFIKRWPIVEGSLTPTPAEPRPETGIQSIKSYKEYLNAWLEDSAPGQDASDSLASLKATQKQNGEVNMNEEELRAIIQEEIANFMGQAKQADEEIKPEEEEEMKQAMEEEAGAVIEEAQETLAALEEELDKGKAHNLIINQASRIIKAAYGAKYKRADTQKAAILEAKKAAMKETPAPTAQEKAGGVKANGAPGQLRTEKYRDLSLEDMSFLYCITQMQQGNYGKRWKFDPDDTFFREFANKAEGSKTARHTPLAIKSINSIKADELDYSTQSGFGDEWVPTVWADDIWRKARLDNVMMGNLRNVDMPSNPWEQPIEAATDGTVFFVAETTDESQLTISGSGAALPDTKIPTAKVQFNAKKLSHRFGYSAELDEDGIAATVPQFREQAERAILDSIDNVVINGDTAAANNINDDGGTPAVTAKFKAFNALIKDALVTNSTNAIDMGGVAPTLKKVRETRFALSNANAFRPSDLMIVCDTSTYAKLLDLDEFITMDKAGALATAQSGQLGIIDGIPLFVSNEMALADTDGKITNGGNVTDTGRLLVVHKPSWWIGFRRRVMQSLTFIPYYDAWQLVTSVRLDLQGRDNDSVSILYNIGV